MEQVKEIDGYSLAEVAKEMAVIYGGRAKSYHVEDDKLVVEISENGECYCAELPLNEIKEFMEM